MLRTNLLTATGIAVSLVAILAVLPRYAVWGTKRSVVSIKSVSLLFVMLGLALKYLIIMPSILRHIRLFLCRGYCATCATCLIWVLL